VELPESAGPPFGGGGGGDAYPWSRRELPHAAGDRRLR